MAGAIAEYLAEICRSPPLTEQQEGELAWRIRRGDAEALDQLVRANLCLVVVLAQTYQGRGIPFSSLIDEGNVGLIRAAHEFPRLARGRRFISFSAWWISREIQDGFRLPALRIVRSGLSPSLTDSIRRERENLGSAIEKVRERVEEALRMLPPEEARALRRYLGLHHP